MKLSEMTRRKMCALIWGMMRTGLIISAALMAALSGAAQHTSEIQFKYLELENGLRVVLSQDSSAPVVAVTIYYGVGSRNELKGKSGLAHLFEHMMFQGSENTGKSDYFKYAESSGGVFNASTETDFTNYYIFLPSNQLELALWLESDRMRSLKITQENLDNQRETVKEEKRLQTDNQAYWPALEKLDRMLYHCWELAHPIIGSMEDLDAATVQDLRDFFDAHYGPNNAVLAIVGDVDLEQTEAMVRKYFAGIPRRKAPPTANISEPLFSVAKRHEVILDPHAQMPAIAVAWKIPPRRSEDSYALTLLKSILLDGESSRLHQRLVKSEAIALSVEGFFEEKQGAPGSISIFSIHKPQVKPQQVLSTIEAEIGRIKAEGIAPEELIKAKNQYRLDKYASLQTALGRALALAEYTLLDGDPSLVNSEMDHYMSVTADQIRAAAAKYLGTMNRSTLFMRPKKQAPARTSNTVKAARRASH